MGDDDDDEEGRKNFIHWKKKKNGKIWEKTVKLTTKSFYNRRFQRGVRNDCCLNEPDTGQIGFEPRKDNLKAPLKLRGCREANSYRGGNALI